MIKQYFCKCCNKKQTSFLTPKILRKSIYQDQYEIIFKKKCNHCTQNNIYLKKKSLKTYELRWKELSDLEERNIDLENEIHRVEERLKFRKKNQKITKKEEEWFIKKIKQLKTSNQKELDKVKKDYRAKIAIKLKYKTK
ncbi:hypothetical protein HIMB114_00006170 [alpha proteobacterium HIMB114]|nr:hypothetical protein HIMB114_00006170 [alpha proteobacterium HIMB114]